MKHGIPWVLRFWGKVIRSDHGCWQWTGPTNSDGYGKYGATPHKTCKAGTLSWQSTGEILVHRIVWSLVNGRIPVNKGVCHDCDNPPCVNPSHLWLGTQKENIEDRDSKGRGITKKWLEARAKGDKHWRSKVTNGEVIEARRLYDTHQLTVIELSRKYDMSASNMQKIVKRTIWRHI